MADQVNNPPEQDLDDIAEFVILRSDASLVLKKSDAGFVLLDR